MFDGRVMYTWCAPDTLELPVVIGKRRACSEQHFFVSAEAAAGWRAQRPGAIVVSVRDGFVRLRALIARWLGTVPTGDAFDRALAVIPSCALDASGASEQKARYARLASSVSSVERGPEAVVIAFDHDLDRDMLERALAVERECCPFLRFEFDRQPRLLRVTVADADMVSALDAIAYALGAKG